MKLIGILILGAIMISLIGCLPPDGYDPTKVEPATLPEVEDFLIADATNETAYNLITYNCLNFAVDLWYNAYQEEFEAFIILLNKEGVLTHVRVGFYLEDKSGDYIDFYWIDEASDKYLQIEPENDKIYMKPRYEDGVWICESKGKGTSELGCWLCEDYEVIAYFYGEDAFSLWQAVSGEGSVIPLIKFYEIILLYKLKYR